MNIKNSWEEITLKEFQELLRIKDSVTLNDLEKDLETILLFSDMSRQELVNMPVVELRNFLKELDFLKEVPEAALKKYYKINGKQYKLISEVDKITAAQFLDLMELVKDKTQVNNRLHEILAVLLLPVKKRKWWQVFSPKKTEKYLETPFEHTSYNLLDIPVVDAFAINNFFFVLSTRFVETSLHYSINESNETLTKLLTTLKQKKQPTVEEQQMIQSLQDLLSNTNGFTT